MSGRSGSGAQQQQQPRGGLSGLRVDAASTKLDRGDEVILTLRDQDILTGSSINDDEDVLENVRMAQQEKRRLAVEASKRKRPLGLRDDADASGASVAVNGVLDKYDEAPKMAPVLQLDEVITAEERAQQEAAVKARLATLAALGESTLEMPMQAASDYFTAQEIADIEFRKGKRGARARRRAPASSSALGEAADVPAADGAFGVNDALAPTTEELGSRGAAVERAAARAAEAQREADERARKYASALQAAQRVTDEVLRKVRVSAAADGDDADDGEGEVASEIALRRALNAGKARAAGAAGAAAHVAAAAPAPAPGPASAVANTAAPTSVAGVGGSAVSAKNLAHFVKRLASSKRHHAAAAASSADGDASAMDLGDGDNSGRLRAKDEVDLAGDAGGDGSGVFVMDETLEFCRNLQSEAEQLAEVKAKHAAMLAAQRTAAEKRQAAREAREAALASEVVMMDASARAGVGAGAAFSGRGDSRSAEPERADMVDGARGVSRSPGASRRPRTGWVTVGEPNAAPPSAAGQHEGSEAPDAEDGEGDGAGDGRHAFRRRQRSSASASQEPDEAGGVASLIGRERLIGAGIGGAVIYMVGRGIDNYEDFSHLSGRASDVRRVKRERSLVESEESGGVTIERVDKFGNVMTPREAFRELSYRFHGTKPSKNKIDKMIKRQDLEARRNSMRDGDTPLGTAAAMKRAQRKAHSAGITIDGGNTALAMVAARGVKRERPAKPPATK